MKVSVNGLSQNHHTLQRLQQRSLRLAGLNHSITKNNVFNYEVQKLNEEQRYTSNKIHELVEFMETSIAVYQQLENKIEAYASKINSICPPKGTLTDFHDHYGMFKDDECIEKHKLHNISKRFHTSLSANKSIIGYIRNGVCAGAYLGYSLYTYTNRHKFMCFDVKDNFYLGKANVTFDAKANLLKNGKYHPNLLLQAKAEANAMKYEKTLDYKGKYIGAEANGNVIVGAASAEAKAVITKDELTLKAEVGASAVKGEAKCALKLFGVEVSLTAAGEIGSVGAGVEFSSKKNEFTFGGRFAAFLGGSFKVNVKYG